jgi:hypothetical protein
MKRICLFSQTMLKPKKWNTCMFETVLSQLLKMKATDKPGVVFKTLHFLYNLRMDQKSWTICLYQAFPALCNVTIKLIGPIRKLRRKWCVVNTLPDAKIELKFWIFYFEFERNLQGNVSRIKWLSAKLKRCHSEFYAFFCQIGQWQLRLSVYSFSLV